MVENAFDAPVRFKQGDSITNRKTRLHVLGDRDVQLNPQTSACLRAVTGGEEKGIRQIRQFGQRASNAQGLGLVVVSAVLGAIGL